MIIFKSNRKFNEPEQISHLPRIWDCGFWENIMGDELLKVKWNKWEIKSMTKGPLPIQTTFYVNRNT